MATDAITPPAGFVLDAGAPPPPAGFSLDETPSSPNPDMGNGNKSFARTVGDFISKAAKAAHPAGETMQDIGQVYPAVEAALNVGTGFVLGFPAYFGGAVGGLIAKHALGLQADPAELAKTMQEAVTYHPMTERGIRLAAAANYPLEQLGAGAEAGGHAVTDLAMKAGASDTTAAWSGAITEQTIGMLPFVLGGELHRKMAGQVITGDDMTNAGNVIAGPSAPKETVDSVTNSLRKIYDVTGIGPYTVMEDAQRNVAVKADLFDPSVDIPKAYEQFVPKAESDAAQKNTEPSAQNEETQAAREFISSVDDGGIALNPAKINKIATDLGLDVGKESKPEETIARIREAVDRADSQEPRQSAASTGETEHTPDTIAQALRDNPITGQHVDTILQRGEEGKAGGLVIGKDLADVQRLFEEKTGRELKGAEQVSESGNTQALYDPKSGLTFMVANRLNEHTAPGVAAHEYIHATDTPKLRKQASDIIANRANIESPELKAFHDSVARRMESAGVAGDSSEAAPYIVEQALLTGRKAGFSAIDDTLFGHLTDLLGKPISNFVKDWVAKARAMMHKRGLDVNLTVDDMVALAQEGIKRATKGDVNAAGGMSHSKNPFGGKESAETPLADGVTRIDVDGVDRSALNSKGQPIHPTEEGVRNFWRWFGDSKVVDAEGRPQVVYHGTDKAFNKIDLKKGAQNLFWFTSDRAAIEAGEVGASGKGATMEMYAKIEHPAGWKQYDQLMLDEFKSRGLDGAVLPESDGSFSGFILHKGENQIKSAISNNGDFNPRNPDIRYSKSAKEGGIAQEFNDIEQKKQDAITKAIDRSIAIRQGVEVQPLKREQTLKALESALKDREAGKLTDTEFADRIESLWKGINERKAAKKMEPMADRARGADFIRQKLLEAKRRGDITGDQSDFAEWFIKKNPALVDDLGISVKTPGEGESGSAGRYLPIQQIIRLFKGSESNTTAVHEILHHMERMMPKDMQDAIRKEFSGRLSAELADAQKSNDTERVNFVQDAMQNYLTGEPAAMERMQEAILKNKVPYSMYRLFNPSEFWAVSMTDVMQKRYAAKNSMLGKTAQWLREAMQHIRGALGLKSDAPMLKALNSVLDGTGEFSSEKMIGVSPSYFSKSDSKSIFDKEPISPNSPFAKAADAWREVVMFADPMSLGPMKAQRAASDYERALTKAQNGWNNIFKHLTERFTPEQLKKMWDAGDEQNVLMQKGESTEGKGIDRLTPEEREASLEIKRQGDALLKMAKDEGMFEGEGLPYWTTRMVIQVNEAGEATRLSGGGSGKQIQAKTSEAKGFSKSAQSLKHREHLTTEETEAAAQNLVDEGNTAMVVRDFRANVIALAKLEKAVAGRRLLNSIKEEGVLSGKDLVGGEGPDFVEIHHPAFMQWRPEMVKNADGKYEPAIDQNGEMKLSPSYLKINKEWEGPLRAVLSQEHDFMGLYKGYMQLKSESMNLIMVSPLIHNMVIFGRAASHGTPVMTALNAYAVGRRLRTDYARQNFMIERGMNPIGNQGFMQDITGIASGESIEHGRSLTVKAIGNLIGKIDPSAAEGFKTGADKIGQFWHGTLLWDVIGDLQRGLFEHAYASKLREGMSDIAAGEFAGHFSNRFAGSVRNSAMSSAARQLLNVSLFSRSFNVGNIGIMKDMIGGMPSDSIAQVQTRMGDAVAARMVSAGKREARASFIKDFGLALVINNAVAAALIAWKQDDLEKGIEDVASHYRDNYQRMMKVASNDSINWLNPWFIPDSMSLLSSNEPGRENKIRTGTEMDGTAIYTRNPAGKVPEDLRNWMMHFSDTVSSKSAPLPKSVFEAATNKSGTYDQPIYEDDARFYQKIIPIVEHVLGAQLNTDMIKQHYDLLTGNESKATNSGILDTPEKQKVFGMWSGLTTSHGYPGGPALGELKAEERDQYQRQQIIMPNVKELLKHGKEEEAVNLMQKAGMTPREIGNKLLSIGNPGRALNRGALRKFYQHADEDARDRFESTQDDK